MKADSITLRDIYMARRTITPYIRRTPLLYSAPLSERSGAHVYLKLECLQETGAFKLRGAANKLLNLTEDERARGVVTVSTGNHGRAVAYMAQQLGIAATICITSLVPPHKRQAMQQLGATLVVAGDNQDDAERHALTLVQERGMTMISPFDDPAIIAGQGTIGLELLEELPQLDTAIVPLSGGGLMGGIALALKTADAAIRVVGASQALGPAMHLSMQAGRPVPVVEEKTLADSLSGGIGLDNRYTFALCRQYVDETVLLSEDEIAAAMTFALRAHHLLVEGGGAVGIGALLHDRAAVRGQHVAVVVSGGNVDVDLLLQLASASRQSDR
ncbi:MAG: hydroxyectoine utilization dehydratase EutB [Caldilineaceae bacterium]